MYTTRAKIPTRSNHSRNNNNNNEERRNNFYVAPTEPTETGYACEKLQPAMATTAKPTKIANSNNLNNNNNSTNNAAAAVSCCNYILSISAHMFVCVCVCVGSAANAFWAFANLLAVLLFLHFGHV